MRSSQPNLSTRSLQGVLTQRGRTAKSSNVLELRHASDRINNCYFTLAPALNLNYFYQSCDPANRSEDPHTADLKVDTGALRANIELMLAS